MKKVVVKYSKLSPEMRKVIRDKLENEDVNFFSFPYQGNMEEGFLLEREEANYLVIVDDEKKSTYKSEDDEEEEEDDFEDVDPKEAGLEEETEDEEEDEYDQPDDTEDDDEKD